MPDRLIGDRRSFLKGMGGGAIAGVGVVGVLGFEDLLASGSGGQGSTLTVRARVDGTNYHVRLTDPDANTVSAPSDTVVSHKNEKTFFAGPLDAGETADFSFDGGVERFDLTAGAAGLTVENPTGDHSGGVSAEGYGLYRVAMTDFVGKAQETETEDATVFRTLQGSVDGDTDNYEAKGAVRHMDVRVAKEESLSLTHSFAES